MSVRTPTLLLLLSFGLSACETRVNGPLPKDDDTGVPFAVESLSPSSGPASGGTSVTVRGSGFTEATTARIGDADCASLTYLSAAELVCVTPPAAPGEAMLVVTEGASSASAAFTYLDDGEDTGDTDTGDTDTGDTDTGDTDTDTDDTGEDTGEDTGDTDTGEDTAVVTVPVDYCHIQYPCALECAAGGASEAVYAWIYQAGVTEGAGVGVGTTLALGWGPDGVDPSDAAWTWTTMVYNLDKDGLVPGDLANDEWAGTLVAPASAGSYDFAVRASADGGASWTFCDLGGDTCGGSGSNDGYDPATAGTLTVE